MKGVRVAKMNLRTNSDSERVAIYEPPIVHIASLINNIRHYKNHVMQSRVRARRNAFQSLPEHDKCILDGLVAKVADEKDMSILDAFELVSSVAEYLALEPERARDRALNGGIETKSLEEYKILHLKHKQQER